MARWGHGQVWWPSGRMTLLIDHVRNTAVGLESGGNDLVVGILIYRDIRRWCGRYREGVTVDERKNGDTQ